MDNNQKSAFRLTQDSTELKAKLEELFDFSSPTSMRRSLLYVFFCFLSKDFETFPGEYERIVADFYFLFNFLDEIEQKN